MKPVEVLLALRTVSEANSHEHWRSRQQRAKSQRAVAYMMTAARVAKYRTALRKGEGDFVVTLTRVAPRALDSDNLAVSQKHVRDGIADALGIDDRDARVEWRYAQERGVPNEYAVGIHVERGPGK